MKKAANKAAIHDGGKVLSAPSTPVSDPKISWRAAIVSRSARTVYGANWRRLHDRPWLRKPLRAGRLPARPARRALRAVVAHSPGFRELASSHLHESRPSLEDSKLQGEMRTECGKTTFIWHASSSQKSSNFCGKRYLFGALPHRKSRATFAGSAIFSECRSCVRLAREWAETHVPCASP
jgi:hypothetical protein